MSTTGNAWTFGEQTWPLDALVDLERADVDDAPAPVSAFGDVAVTIAMVFVILVTGSLACYAMLELAAMVAGVTP